MDKMGMTQHRKNAVVLGILYILATVSAIIAVILYIPIMAEDWYSIVGNGQRNSILLGVLSDCILLVSAVGTTIMLAPYLRHLNRHLALAYYSFRFMEAVFIGMGLVSVLILVSLSDGYAAGSLPQTEGLMASGVALQSLHRWTMVLGPNLMLGINTLIYSGLLSVSKLVPKPLAQFGMLSAVLVFVAGILDMYSIIEPWSLIKGGLSLPVAAYEMILAVYLIIKGFRRDGLDLISSE